MTGNEPAYVSMLTEAGESPAGFGTGFNEEDVYDMKQTSKPG